MRLTSLFCLAAGAHIAAAGAGWNFDEAIISVSGKGTAGGSFKDKLSDHVPLSNPVTLGADQSLKIIVTATDDGIAKRPHQAFLLLRDTTTGLEATYPFAMKSTGKGKVDVTHQDLPIQLLISTAPLRATILLASFGKSQAFSNHVFDLQLQLDPSAVQPTYTPAPRYSAKPEIHHIFKADPTSPPKIVSIVFTAAVLATVPFLFGAWLYLDANLGQLSAALGTAPVSHALFFGSVIALEGIFALYYLSWNLFQTLPVAGAVGAVAFYSGSKALSEVQSRRLAGKR